MFEKEFKQLSRRWQLLTGYTAMVNTAVRLDQEPEEVVDIIEFVTDHLECIDDEVPMGLINYVCAYVRLHNELPPLDHLEEKARGKA